MPALRRAVRGAAGFFSAAELIVYPQDRLHQEIAFLAYYLHWPRRELMDLDHRERRRWCEEVSAINKKLSGDERQSHELR
jgi:hypothetical protein